MKDSVHSTKRLIASFLLILFMGYVSSVSLFQHGHIVNGQLIAHSHPYSDTSETGQHTHTSCEFITIAALSVLQILAVSLGFLLILFAVQLLKKVNLEDSTTLIRTPFTLFLRGPPVC